MTKIFTRIPPRVVSDNELSASDKLTMLSICSFLNNKSDSCSVSIKKIKEHIGIKDDRTIRVSIQKLMCAGHILVNRRAGKSNIYVVDFYEKKQKIRSLCCNISGRFKNTDGRYMTLASKYI